MKTDEQRWADLLAAAASARLRVKEMSTALHEVGIRAELARHIDVALRRLPAGPNGSAVPLEEVKAIVTAIADLVRIAAAAGVAEDVLDRAEAGRRELTRSADAFLVDTQVL